jgi:hypothetical protein
MCLRYPESDELASYGNKGRQVHGTIHTDISRERRQCSEIREAGDGNLVPRFEKPEEHLAFENCSLNMQIGDSQNPEESNGAGTFRFLVTLKKHERKNAPQGWLGLSWRTDYD